MQAVDRYGNVYHSGELVQMKDFPVLYNAMAGKSILIEEIKECEYSESGFNVLLKDVESGKTFKRWLDTNWIQKLKT